MTDTYVLAYDIGTTGMKTCLFRIGYKIELVVGATEGYGLFVLDNGGVEQDSDEWWEAMKKTTKRVMEKANVPATRIRGISFCSQMQGLVLVDREKNVLRRPMSYMDQRAGEEIKKGIANGVQIAGANVLKLIPSLRITGAVSSSVKDPMWKYKWVEAHEPEIFNKIYKWLDVKEFFVLKCTGRCVMTEDSAYGTLLYDTRKGHRGWSKKLCSMFGIKMSHLPEIVSVTDEVGPLLPEVAKELDLVPGIPVFGGGGDATLIGVGAGCVKVGDTHIYSGTSGWVSTVVNHQMVDADNMIAAIVGAQSDKYNYFAEMETAGKCLEWVKNHLALDEIGIYLEHNDITGSVEKVYTSLYEYMTKVVAHEPAGSNGVIFTPWLHGNRCPFEDPNARGMFFNISLENGKSDMIRAVLEGVCYHVRWMLECQKKKLDIHDPVRFVGGGALSDVTSQILADITGHKIEVVSDPQNVGSVGAAAAIAVGIGMFGSIEETKALIPAEKTFYPNDKHKEIYDKQFAVFKDLYRSNVKNFERLNHGK